MKNSKLLKKGDILIIVSIAVVSLLWFFLTFLSFGEKQQVRIYLDGEVYRSIELSQVKEEETVEFDGCEILVTKEGACFLSSDCPDGLCVKRGMMTKSGDVMACVPKGITLEVAGGRAVDGISY